jgi:hypothetical protein
LVTEALEVATAETVNGEDTVWLFNGVQIVSVLFVGLGVHCADAIEAQTQRAMMVSRRRTDGRLKIVRADRRGNGTRDIKASNGEAQLTRTHAHVAQRCCRAIQAFAPAVPEITIFLS